MARCFCGCGRDVPFRRRSINKRGAFVEEELALSRALFGKGMRSPNATALVRDGELLCMQLADALHTGNGPSAEVDREAREFVEIAREHFGPRAFGRALKRSKLKEEKAMALLEMGEWDPFARSELPPSVRSPAEDGAPRPTVPPSVRSPAQGAAPRPTVPPSAPEPSGDLLGDLERLATLHAGGALTDEEFAQAKRRLLDRG